MKKNNLWNGSKKGQAVMEYLITYGLALFVILIVLAILVAVVLPSLKAPETCQFTQPGFSCNSRPDVLVADSSNNVNFLFQLDNNEGQTIEVQDILCTTEAPGSVQKSDVDASHGTVNLELTPKIMASGSSVTVGSSVPPASDIPNAVVCYNQDNTKVQLSPGSNFKGSLVIVYKYQNEVPGAPPRVAVATLTGSVQKG